MNDPQEFVDAAQNEVPVRGFIHCPPDAGGDCLVLTHGAGSNSNSPLLVALADTFCASGLTVLRCDLPFRQLRPHGPPPRGSAERDQEGLRAAIASMRRQTSGRIFLGGHSYGGRQATMLAASQPGLVDRLLLLSYPLHPPQRPSELRTEHFPNPNDVRTRHAGRIRFHRRIGGGVDARPGTNRTASGRRCGARTRDEAES
jgi:uncharacterized protein